MIDHECKVSVDLERSIAQLTCSCGYGYTKGIGLEIEDDRMPLRFIVREAKWHAEQQTPELK
jgi:hypothetical protein